MNPNAITIASGIILIVILALVGWHQKRRDRGRNSDTRVDPERRQ